MAKNLQGKQRSWNEATQRRLAMTTSMLSSMKNLKMLGVASYTESLIRKLRLQELTVAKKVRWMMVAYNASGTFSVRCLMLYNMLILHSKRFGNLLAHHYLCSVCLVRAMERINTRHGDGIYHYCSPRAGHSSCKHDHVNYTRGCWLTCRF